MAEWPGAVPEPLEVMAHDPAIAEATTEFGARAGSWEAAEEPQDLRPMAVAAQVGCAWCQDVDPAKASQVPRRREADVFAPLEREVKADAEAMSAAPPTVLRRWSPPCSTGIGRRSGSDALGRVLTRRDLVHRTSDRDAQRAQ